MSQPFTWASVAKGKPQTTVTFEAEQAAREEKERIKKEALARLAFEEAAPRRAYDEAKRVERANQDKVIAENRALWLARRDLQFSKEEGYLKEWALSSHVPRNTFLSVPPNVNERARDWTEKALASWWTEWEKCDTVEALRAAFINAFVPCCLHGEGKYQVRDFEYWEKTERLPNGTRAERYANLLKWVKFMETGYSKPYANPLWVDCKNITFENCLWAMNVQAHAFQALDKHCPASDVLITGFLQLKPSGVIRWCADFSKYIPYKHHPKPKCQARQ